MYRKTINYDLLWFALWNIIGDCEFLVKDEAHHDAS